MNFATVNLGCKVNYVELEGIARQLMVAGLIPSSEADADVIVVNTCTVTGEADKKTRKAVNHALAANEYARVVVTGCAIAIDPSYYQQLDSRISVVNRVAMPMFLAELTASAEGLQPHEDAPLPGAEKLFRTRTGIKIQDGCNHACTYCIVHTARGASYSVPREEVLAQVVEQAAQGRKEIVLTGINLGSYGDEQGGLASLLRDCLEVADCHAMPGSVRFRISSIEPTEVDDELISLMTEANGRICRHLHIPLQSGSSAVLREMDRPYTAGEYRALISRLRDALPSISLTTDVIVGFPGETEEQFQETVDLCSFAGFSKLHVFPYSVRRGTPAAERSDQVSPQVKQARAAQLRELSADLRAQDADRRVGTTETVVAEGNGYGFTESYHRVAVDENIPEGAAVSYTFPVVE